MKVVYQSFSTGTPGWHQAYRSGGSADLIVGGPGPEFRNYPGPKAPDREPDRRLPGKISEWDLSRSEMEALVVRLQRALLERPKKEYDYGRHALMAALEKESAAR